MSLDHSTLERRKSARSRRGTQQLRLLATLQHEEDGARRRLQAMRCFAVLYVVRMLVYEYTGNALLCCAVSADTGMYTSILLV
jgi:hypothetical protein